ncbi:MAG: hypothetical protein P4L10_08220 [Acidobacteriaceae bacterium]|nr:hypothetical protein [Acidobacteriaceae bacterium]
MKGEASEARDAAAIVYLQQLQLLAAEIQVAMKAIASNALSVMEESVAKQEMLCAVLREKAKTIGDGLRSPVQRIPHCPDDTIEFRIMTTSAAIRELNLQYASLLKHSGRSIHLLASLCRSQAGQIREDRGTRSKRQTWSCEM